jgi:ABC-type nitrate/sulfonate/bicarbonate transport system substrate-binding protein
VTIPPDLSRLPGRPLSRRGFLLGGAAATTMGVLAACGSSSKSSTSSAPTGASSSGGGGKADYGTLTVQLDWLHDVEFGGDYLAQKRNYAQAEGFSGGLKITAGGPSISSEPAVTSGKAFLGYSVPSLVASANAGGAKVKVIGATLKKNPYVIMSAGKSPITEPSALVGKKVAVDTQNAVVLKSFLVTNKVDPSKVTTVPANFDPTLLSSGQVDAYVAYFNSEPITLALAGFDVHVMEFEQFNSPGIGDIYIVKASSIEDDRDKVKAALRAVTKGWQDFVRKNSDAVPLTIELAGKASTATAEFWQKEADVTRSYVLADADTDGGLLIMSEDHQQKIIDSLAAGGLKTDVATFFDMSLLKEIYQADSALAAVPTPA